MRLEGRPAVSRATAKDRNSQVIPGLLPSSFPAKFYKNEEEEAGKQCHSLGWLYVTRQQAGRGGEAEVGGAT